MTTTFGKYSPLRAYHVANTLKMGFPPPWHQARVTKLNHP